MRVHINMTVANITDCNSHAGNELKKEKHKRRFDTYTLRMLRSPI